MKSNYKTIGELVEKVDIRNTDGEISKLLGLSIDKCYIDSVANTIGTDLTKYKVLKKNFFACSLMQVSRDNKIPICRYDSEVPAIISPAYPMFRVKNESEIMPEFLDMWFKRSEFDREVSFIAVGGVRGSMPWEDFCNIEVPVPDIEKQQAIVKAYQVVTDRIALKEKINVKLEFSCELLFHQLCLEDSSEIYLKDIALLSAGGDRPSEFSEISTELCTIPIFSNGLEQEGLYGYTTQPRINDECITISARGTVGYVFHRNRPFFPMVRLISVVPKENYVTAKYLYFFLKFAELPVMQGKGSTQQQITVPDMKEIKIDLPTKEEMNNFETKCKTFFKIIYSNKDEIIKLKSLQSLLLSRLATE